MFKKVFFLSWLLGSYLCAADSYESGNIQTVISVINALNGQAPLQNSYFTTFLGLSTEDQNIVARELENSQFKGLQEAVQEETFQINAANFDMLLTKRSAGTCPFVYGVYDQVRQEMVDDYNSFKAINETVFLGVTKSTKDFVALVALGYGYTHVKYGDIASSSKSNNFMLDFGVSASRGMHDIAFDVLALTSLIDQSRSIPYYAMQAYGSHPELGVKGEVYYGATWKQERLEVVIFDRLGYLFLWETAYTEHGAHGLNLQVMSSKYNMICNRLGLGLKHKYTKNFLCQAQVAWVFEERFQSRQYADSFIGTNSYFNIDGYQPSRSLIAVDFAFRAMHESWDLALVYNGLFGEKFMENTGKMEFGFKF